MSNGFALEVQKGVRATLLAATAVTDLVSTRIYDEPPTPVTYYNKSPRAIARRLLPTRPRTHPAPRRTTRAPTRSRRAQTLRSLSSEVSPRVPSHRSRPSASAARRRRRRSQRTDPVFEGRSHARRHRRPSSPSPVASNTGNHHPPRAAVFTFWRGVTFRSIRSIRSIIRFDAVKIRNISSYIVY